MFSFSSFCFFWLPFIYFLMWFSLYNWKCMFNAVCELHTHLWFPLSLIYNLRFISLLSQPLLIYSWIIYLFCVCVFMSVCVWGGGDLCTHVCITEALHKQQCFFELINMLVLSSEACSDLHFHTTDHKSDERAYCAIKTYVNDYESSTQPKLHLIWSDMIWYDNQFEKERMEYERVISSHYIVYLYQSITFRASLTVKGKILC